MGKEYTLSMLFRVKDDGSVEIKKVSKSFEELGKKSTVAGKQIENATKKMQKSTDPLKKTGKNIRQFTDGLGEGLAAGAMRYAGPAMLGLALKSAADAGMQFNEAMANVGTLIPGNLKRLEQLKEGTASLSRELGIGHTEMAQGLYEVVSAYGDTSDTMEKMRITAVASKAGLATASDSLNLLSQVTKAYGDNSAEAMKKASDLAFAAVRDGQTSFAALSQSMSRVTETMAALGVSQEEMFATMATFTRGAQTTPQVVTQLNATMTALLKPTEAMKARLSELNFESGQAMLKQKGLGETMRLLTNDGKASAEQMAGLFGSAEAMRMAMAFSGPSMNDYITKLDRMKQAGGSTAAALNEQINGINESGEAYKRMNVAIEGMKIAFWDLAAAPMGSVFEGMANGLNAMNTAIAETKKDLIGEGSLLDLLARLGKIAAVGAAGPVGWVTAAKALANEGYFFESDKKSIAKDREERAQREKEASEKKKESDKLEVKLVLPTDDEGNPIINADVRSNKGTSIQRTTQRLTATGAGVNP